VAAKKKPAPKRGASRYQAPPRKPVPGWVWLTCGLLIGAFVVFLLQLEPGRDEVKRIKDEKPRQTSSQANKPTPNAQPAAPAKPKYDFYTLLPESEVIVPPDAMTQPPAAAMTPEQLAKADAARAEAALNGQVPPAFADCQHHATHQHANPATERGQSTADHAVLPASGFVP